MEGTHAQRVWNTAVQVCLPGFTILGYALVAAKMPQYGVIAGLISQIFWAYASYRAWKEGQWGIALTTAVLTIVFIYGIINYWYL